MAIQLGNMSWQPPVRSAPPLLPLATAAAAPAAGGSRFSHPATGHAGASAAVPPLAHVAASPADASAARKRPRIAAAPSFMTSPPLSLPGGLSHWGQSAAVVRPAVPTFALRPTGIAAHPPPRPPFPAGPSALTAAVATAPRATTTTINIAGLPVQLQMNPTTGKLAYSIASDAARNGTLRITEEQKAELQRVIRGVAAAMQKQFVMRTQKMNEAVQAPSSALAMAAARQPSAPPPATTDSLEVMREAIRKKIETRRWVRHTLLYDAASLTRMYPHAAAAFSARRSGERWKSIKDAVRDLLPWHIYQYPDHDLLVNQIPDEQANTEAISLTKRTSAALAKCESLFHREEYPSTRDALNTAELVELEHWIGDISDGRMPMPAMRGPAAHVDPPLTGKKKPPSKRKRQG